MTDLLLDIVAFLVSKGAIQGDGIDTFRDEAPEAPDNITVLYEYLGTNPIAQIDHIGGRSIQVTTRNVSATAAKIKARELYNHFITMENVLYLTETRWCILTLRNMPIKIKKDSKERVTYGFNIGIVTYND